MMRKGVDLDSGRGRGVVVVGMDRRSGTLMR